MKTEATPPAEKEKALHGNSLTTKKADARGALRELGWTTATILEVIPLELKEAVSDSNPTGQKDLGVKEPPELQPVLDRSGLPLWRCSKNVMGMWMITFHDGLCSTVRDKSQAEFIVAEFREALKLAVPATAGAPTGVSSEKWTVRDIGEHGITHGDILAGGKVIARNIEITTAHDLRRAHNASLPQAANTAGKPLGEKEP